jgi:hypothetical protein
MDKSTTGRLLENERREIVKGELEMWVISQLAATSCTQVPIFERNAQNQKIR